MTDQVQKRSYFKAKYPIKKPSTIYHEFLLLENPNQKFIDGTTAWHNCKDKKMREVVLREAFRIVKEVATEENVDDMLMLLKKKILREHLGYLLGEEFPLMRPFIYYKKNCQSLKHCVKRNFDEERFVKLQFIKIPFHRQLKYLKRFLNDWLGFFFKFDKWKSENNDIVSESLAKLTLFEMRKRSHRLTKDNCRKKKFLEVCMPHTVTKFDDTPEEPTAMSVLKLFGLIIGEETGSKDKEVLKNAFERLPTVVQNGIEDHVIVTREDFKNKLFCYVRSLSDLKLKLFLGLKREYYYKLFKEDIFEEKFPNDKYPVYKRNSDSFLKKAAQKKNVCDGISPEDDRIVVPEDLNVFQLVDDSLLRLKNYGFDIDSMSDSDT